MTEAEAKEYMKNEIRCIQRASYCDRDCAKCNLVKEEEPLLEAFGMAIKALEKQIAKKPIFNTWSPVKCPTCGCDLNKSIGDGYYQRCIPMKFCECGQKLDWSEV